MNEEQKGSTAQRGVVTDQRTMQYRFGLKEHCNPHHIIRLWQDRHGNSRLGDALQIETQIVVRTVVPHDRELDLALRQFVVDFIAYFDASQCVAVDGSPAGDPIELHTSRMSGGDSA